MCGIAGIVQKEGVPVNRDRLIGMSSRIAHRGPDGDGLWMEGCAGLAHRRLAIVDLSSAGNQPMRSQDGRYVIVFNGELYNYQELRKRLAESGERFRSTSDTEVLLALYVQEGERLLDQIRGMFAFAIWDTQERSLFFARDRIGKKPFYYRTDEIGFSFASELPALLEEGEPVDWDTVRTYFGLQYVPSPKTGFSNIRSLQPGHYGRVKNGSEEIVKYGSFDRHPKLELSFRESAERLGELLQESVKLRLIADVPVGVFLSGGIDSSSIACLAARESQAPLKTFTMGFPSLGFDEREQAASLAKKIGTEHHAFEARPEEALSLVDEIIGRYGSPYADSSALPVWLLAKETSNHVKAVLAGDGGDELFAGYRRYRHFKTADLAYRFGAGSLGVLAARALHLLSNDPRYMRFAATLEGRSDGYERAYAALFTGSYFDSREEASLLKPEFLSQTEGADAAAFVAKEYRNELGLEGALDFDLRSYLPDDLNVKLDRATMAHGLEARCPFLDQDLVHFAARLPSEYTIGRRMQKDLLHEALIDIVPAEVFSRPKRGFQVPLADWFRGPLRSAFVERCLSNDAKLANICRLPEVKRLLHENDRGVDHGNRLWMLFSLSTWLETYA